MKITEGIKLKLDLLKIAIKEAEKDGRDHSITTAGEKGLRSGKVSELTVILPFKEGGAERLRAIFKYLNGNLSAVSKVGTVQNLRFIFFDNDTRLLFASCYDGDWDSYINDFATKIPMILDIVFENVAGWPGIKDPAAKQFILDHQFTAEGWYVATNTMTVNDIIRNEKIVNGLNKVIEAASVK